MTDQPQYQTEQDPTTVDHSAIRTRLDELHLDSQRQANRISDLFNSAATHETQRWVAQDGNVEWMELLTFVGGIERLHAEYMTPDGQHPDLDKLIPVVDALFDKTAVTEFAGGMTMRRYPQNRGRK